MLDAEAKVVFNPNNKQHVRIFATYLFHKKWDPICPFKLEYPYITVPEMCSDKLLKHYLQKYK